MVGWYSVYQLNMPLQVGSVLVQHDQASNWIDLRGRCFISLFLSVALLHRSCDITPFSSTYCLIRRETQGRGSKANAEGLMINFPLGKTSNLVGGEKS